MYTRIVLMKDEKLQELGKRYLKPELLPSTGDSLLLHGVQYRVKDRHFSVDESLFEVELFVEEAIKT